MPIDYKKYPPNWKTEIRPRILERAKYKCEVKGCEFRHLDVVVSFKEKGKTRWIKANEQNDKIDLNDKLVRVVLTIAHLDHDEHNHNVTDDRLKAMCQLHHLRYDAEEKKRRKNLNR